MIHSSGSMGVPRYFVYDGRAWGRVPNHIGRVISCGEPLPPGFRALLEDTFHCTVINFYGFSESLALGLEEQSGDGLKNYQFVQTSEVSFQIRAEARKNASMEKVIEGIGDIMEPLLFGKVLQNIHYEICFVDTIEVNDGTEKKQLIIRQLGV